MPPILMWVLVVVAAAVCGALGYYFGGENRKRTAEAKIGSAEEEAKRIVNDANKAAEQTRRALNEMHMPELDYFMVNCMESFSMTLDELE